MYRHRHAVALTAGLAAGLAACSEPPVPVVEEIEPVAPTTAIPITTRSEEAYDLFVEGRRLSDRIRHPEARDLYLEAIAKDRHFALAHLALANTSVSAREFFESMERAVALSEVVSEGERRMILARDAAVRGDQAEQFEHLERLVELHPTDPRAHQLLGGYHSARQEFTEAIEHFEHAVDVDPEFSPPYNHLGYLNRALGRYEAAEEAFLRYIELIPDEPNPYDSYAELLMKIGRFEESIEAYEKALAVKSDFLPSLSGIAYDLIFLERFEEAREVLARQLELAPNIGQRRNAMLVEAYSFLHQGDLDAALEVIEEMRAVAEANGDPVSMAGDLMSMGAILVSREQADRAEELFIEAVRLIGDASVPDDVKDNVRRNFLYWKARIELARGRLADAERHLDAYREQVEMHQIPSELRNVQDLAGALALERGDAEQALSELASASQQSPRVLYLTALAHEAAGDLPAARKLARQAAEFNSFGLTYALVRRPALQLVERLD